MEAVGEHYRLAADIAIKALGLEGCADTLVVSGRGAASRRDGTSPGLEGWSLGGGCELRRARPAGSAA
jgi:hypothetical protein